MPDPPDPIDIHILLDVHIHQHHGDPNEDAEITIGGPPPVTVNATTITGTLRREVMARIRGFEMPQ